MDVSRPTALTPRRSALRVVGRVGLLLACTAMTSCDWPWSRCQLAELLLTIGRALSNGSSVAALHEAPLRASALDRRADLGAVEQPAARADLLVEVGDAFTIQTQEKNDGRGDA